MSTRRKCMRTVDILEVRELREPFDGLFYKYGTRGLGGVSSAITTPLASRNLLFPGRLVEGEG
jgi:hypothetical protein